ncbi:MAG TPA: hypothetical protein DCZ55_12250 [Cyanobacteria bacterium UBA11371]|nr:hypothetical protein [Cyanobacteria bacterium UBA11371]
MHPAWPWLQLMPRLLTFMFLPMKIPNPLFLSGLGIVLSVLQDRDNEQKDLLLFAVKILKQRFCSVFVFFLLQSQLN